MLEFSADTAPDEGIPAFATGTSIFPGGVCAADTHLTGAVTWKVCWTISAIGRLVVTHLPKDAAESSMGAMGMQYPGPVEYAQPGKTIRD